MAQKAPDYSIDPNLSSAVKTFLKSLNAGDSPLESHAFGLLNGLAETPQVKALIELAAAGLKKHLK